MADRIRIKVTGLETARRRINQLVKSYDDRVVESIERSGLLVESDAKRLAPNKTSTLERSITSGIVEHTSTKVEAQVGSNLSYAVPLEFGVRGGKKLKHASKAGFIGKPTPYLFPALKLNFDRIVRDITRALKRATKDAAGGR